MRPMSSILSVVAMGCLLATATLMPCQSAAETDKLKVAMAALIAETTKLGEAKVQGRELYFGTTRADNPLVESVAKEQGGAATIFVNVGNEFIRIATTVNSSALGTPLDPTSPAATKLIGGAPYYGDANVFGVPYSAGYEPIKDAAGTVIGAYFVGYPVA